MEVLGLIAGQGRLPFLVAQGAKQAGVRVVCVGLAGQADSALAEEVDAFCWVGMVRLGQWIRRLKKQGVTRAIMVGRVSKQSMYRPWRIVRYLPDWRALRLWYGTLGKKDKRNDTLLAALADELARGGIILENSVKYCQDHLAKEGVLTRRGPSASEMRDMDFGWDIVKRMGDLDIGQAMAVKEGEVIAVEAIEGTDEMIERAGGLCQSGGWMLIKTAKPNQDMRFDVPTIGQGTIENLKKNKGRCLVVEAEKTLIIDMPETLQLADKYKITVVGRKG